MATRETNINVQLFNELVSRYPEVPQDVISKHLRMTNNDKDQCMKLLQTESSTYLYGQSHNSVANKIQNLTLNSRTTDNKPSTFTNQQSEIGLMNPVQSWPSPTNMSAVNTSYTAPVVATDFDSFMEAASSKQSNIPNIHCKADSSPSVSQTVKKFEVTSAIKKTSPVTGKRPVPVFHCGTTDSGQSAVKNNSYQIQTSGNSGKEPVHSQVFSYIDTAHNVINNPPPLNQYATQTSILINQPNNGLQNTERSYIRSPQYGVGNDPHHNVYRQPAPHTSPILGYQQSSSNLTTNYNKPIFVKIKSSGPEGSETRVRYNYQTSMENQLPSYGSPSPNTIPRTRQNPFAPGPQLQIASINKSNVGNNSTFVQYPQYPNNVGLSARLTTSSRTSSVESEHGSVFLVQEGEIVYPMSPASSHSSLSSESSIQVANTRPASGTEDPDQEYIRALLYHQSLRLENLKKDYDDTNSETEKLKQEVAQMETNMMEKNTRKNSFPTLEDVSKLYEINRRLQTDIQCMGNEIDMKKTGPGQFSLVDPVDQQNFFANMPTGPSGSIGRPLRINNPPPPIPPPPGSGGVMRPQAPLDISPLDVVPPVPPRQPSAGSGDSEEGEHWNCSACTFLNHPAVTKCEICEMPRISLGSS